MSWMNSMSGGSGGGATVANGGVGQSGIQGGTDIPVSDSLSPQTNAALAQGGQLGNAAANLYSTYVQPYADLGKDMAGAAKSAYNDPLAALKKAEDFGIDAIKARVQQRMAQGGQAAAPTPNQKGHSFSIGNLLSSYTGGAYHSGSGASNPLPPAQTQAGMIRPQTDSGNGTNFAALFQNLLSR